MSNILNNTENLRNVLAALQNKASGGTSEDLEALGALCDWQVVTDSESYPIVNIWNMHPSYYLHCTIFFDGETFELVVPPDDVGSISLEEYGVAFSRVGEIDIQNVRWSANA